MVHHALELKRRGPKLDKLRDFIEKCTEPDKVIE